MERNLSNTTTTELNSAGLDYKTPSEHIDDTEEQKRTYWDNTYWSEGLGIYKNIPEFKEAIRALARWAIGRGYNVEQDKDKITLDNIEGWGEDSFQSIMTSLIITKKINGDAYAEIIRDEKDGRLVNLIPLNPRKIRVLFNKKGLIEGYTELGKDGKPTEVKWQPEEIFHISNDRIASEIHGTPSWEAVKWVIEARNEAMRDWRRISHRSSIRVIYCDIDNPTKLSELRTQWKTAIKDGEVLVLPGRQNKDIEVMDYTTPPLQPFLDWIRYLEGFFYQAVGIPKAIANTSDFTEAASKVGYMTFEPVYVEEQTLLEQDIWNQLAIRIKFNRPPSLSGMMQEEEQKNQGQVGFQPNESELNIQRTE